MKQNRPDSIKYLTLGETDSLFKVIKDRRDRALFLIAYRHGLRASEVGLIALGDVDLSARRIRLRRLKGSFGGVYLMDSDELVATRRLIHLIGQTSFKRYRQGLAGDHLDSNRPLFVSNRQTPISRRTLDYLMKGYCSKAGIATDKAHFHVLKHSIATHLITAGMGIEKVRDWLGHANIENTLVYARLTNQARDSAAREAFSHLPKF